MEQSVLLAERWIMARLRHARFFSLAELNAAITVENGGAIFGHASGGIVLLRAA